MSKPPITIRLIAWALIVLGTLSISEILVQFFLYDQILFDLNVFLVPIGMGLLRRSELSRWWASVSLGIWNFGIFIGLAANIYYSFYEQADSVTLGLSLLSCAFLLLVFGWAWKESCSIKTREWFTPTSGFEEERKPFQFRLSTLLYCTTLLAFVCVIYREDIVYHPMEIHSEVRGTWEGMASVTYGLHRPRWGGKPRVVDFVVVEMMFGNRPFRSCVAGRTSAGRVSATLHVPEGPTIQLPGGYAAFYEINDGVYRTLPGEVTIQQLKAYLDQSWDELSIDDLLSMPLAEKAGDRSRK